MTDRAASDYYYGKATRKGAAAAEAASVDFSYGMGFMSGGDDHSFGTRDIENLMDQETTFGTQFPSQRMGHESEEDGYPPSQSTESNRNRKQQSSSSPEKNRKSFCGSCSIVKISLIVLLVIVLAGGAALTLWLVVGDSILETLSLSSSSSDSNGNSQTQCCNGISFDPKSLGDKICSAQNNGKSLCCVICEQNIQEEPEQEPSETTPAPVTTPEPTPAPVTTLKPTPAPVTTPTPTDPPTTIVVETTPEPTAAPVATSPPETPMPTPTPTQLPATPEPTNPPTDEPTPGPSPSPTVAVTEPPEEQNAANNVDDGDSDVADTSGAVQTPPGSNSTANGRNN